MEKIKVLIADDSVVYRSQIRAALQDLPQVEIVGATANGKLALEKLNQFPVDLLILDLEMPVMDGISTLRELRGLNSSPKSLVFSSHSRRGAEITLEALSLGASDFITKPSAVENQIPAVEAHLRIRELLLPKISALFSRSNFEREIKPASYPKVLLDILSPKIIVIGSSTGGPTVLEKIFSQVNGPLQCPIVIAQHMPPIFTATFAERLTKVSGLEVREAVHGEILRKDCVYLAPGDFHLRLSGTMNQTMLTLDQGPQINSVRPAVDPLFESASQIFGDKCLGIILTGMGSDGAAGAVAIKKNNGAIFIQEEKSCVVFGMPGAVFRNGAYDGIATPEEIIELIRDKAMGFRSGIAS